MIPHCFCCVASVTAQKAKCLQGGMSTIQSNLISLLPLSAALLNRCTIRDSTVVLSFLNAGEKMVSVDVPCWVLQGQEASKIAWSVELHVPLPTACSGEARPALHVQSSS